MTASLAAATQTAAASPITLTIATDTPLLMKGAITGRLLDTTFAAGTDHVPVTTGGYYNTYSAPLAVQGTNWHVWGSMSENMYYSATDQLLSISYGISLFGQHMVAPHADEIAPTNLDLLVYADNLSGASGVTTRSPALQLSDTMPHPTTNHVDTMTLSLYDLNGNSPGYLQGDQFAANFTLTHPVPEPETYAMMLAGLGVIGALGRRKLRPA